MEKSEVKIDAAATDPPPSLENGFVDQNTTHLGHGEVEVIKIREGNAVLRKLREGELWLDRKLKIEGMGAERIPESERRPPHVLNVSIRWPLNPPRSRGFALTMRADDDLLVLLAHVAGLHQPWNARKHLWVVRE